MPAAKSETLRGQVITFLNLNYSVTMILKIINKEKLVISRPTVNRIKSQLKHKEDNVPPAKKSTMSVGRKSLLLPRQQRKLLDELIKDDPKTESELSHIFGVQPHVIQYFKRKMELKKVKKPKVHALSSSVIEKRYKRSWQLYRLLRKNRWQKVITSDEALFYVNDAHGKRTIQYIARWQTRKEADVLSHVEQSQRVMVWLAISHRGIISPVFVEPGVKINAGYYQKKVLSHLSRQAKRFYPKNDYLFHQDSAPAHTARTTVQWLNERKIKFITKEQWMPCSPDCAPLDYFVWGYLKGKVQKHKVSDINGLKKAIRIEVRKMPQDLINKALRSWPKRLRKVYYARGGNIENY